ncbi:MAG: AbrB family transcriptional regulator [Elioraea sp.]|nr:AbrB family transcriptional regulator [Elioraea sp.]
MPADRARLLIRQAATFALAASGGFVAARLGVPLAWMVGAMVAVAGAALAGARVAAPEVVRPAALIVLGTGLGQGFTPPVLAAVAASLPAMVAAGVGTILAGAIASRATARIGAIDSQTAYYASVPGGVVVMAVLAARAGLPVGVVTLTQTLRMMLVVLVYPPLVVAFVERGRDAFSLPSLAVVWPLLPLLLALASAGALLLRSARLANPWMMGPVLVSLALAMTGEPLSGLPAPLVDLAQLLLGWTLGTRLERGVVLRAPRLALAAVVSMAIVAALCLLLALAIVGVFRLPFPPVLLGTAPGGMPELAITAKVLDLGAPLVLAFHLVRVLLCTLLVPPFWRLYQRAMKGRASR